jgi:integrating conjugative element protein (TIGR03757 family)
MKCIGSLGVSGILLSVCATVRAADIELFTTRRWPVIRDLPAETQVYVLDAPEQIEAALSTHLPADVLQAASDVQNALANEWQGAGKALTQAYQGLYKAKTYGLTQVPALVIEGQVRAYGAAAVADALQRLASPRTAHP